MRAHAQMLVLLSATVAALGAAKYDGPRPPEADVPYLMHADNLLPTERATAREDQRKDGIAYVMDGASSSAKTPLAEPIFLFKAGKLQPEKFSCYRLQTNKAGGRELFVSNKKNDKVSRPIPLKLTRLDEGLYRIEVDQPLENGEYTLSPEGSNDTFSFQIY